MMTLREKGVALTVLAFLNVVTLALGTAMGILGVLLAVAFLSLSATAGVKILGL